MAVGASAGGAWQGSGVVLLFWFPLACGLCVWLANGIDLAPLVIAARLVERGLDHLLYARALDSLLVSDPHWAAEAASLGYHAQVVPFLYPPLVAHLMIPAAHVGFTWLSVAFSLAAAGAITATVLLGIRHWNPAWLQPKPLLFVLCGVTLSHPFIFGASTGNVQPFVILAVVIAMIASQRGRPALAGLILALATAVKILPGVLAIYWLFSRRRDCFAWFVAGMIVFASASLVLAGVGPNIAFLKNVHALSGVLVPSWFNEGLPTFLYGFVGEIDLGASLRLVPVPAWISAMTCAATLGGLAVILLGARRARDLPAADAAGMAASFLLVTIASPMAWTEYYVFLAVPAVIWGGLTAGRAGWILPVAVAVLASFVAKLALEALVRIGAPRFLVESELIAAVALLIGLWAARRQLFRRVGVSARGNRHGQPDGDAFDD